MSNSALPWFQLLLKKPCQVNFITAVQIMKLRQCEGEGSICNSSGNKLYTRQSGLPQPLSRTGFHVV